MGLQCHCEEPQATKQSPEKKIKLRRDSLDAGKRRWRRSRMNQGLRCTQDNTVNTFVYLEAQRARNWVPWPNCRHDGCERSEAADGATSQAIAAL